ncbi:MAG: DNA repair protein RadC [bacterium]
MKKEHKPYEGHHKRLRESFEKSPESLSDHEVLELLLTYIIPRRDTKPQAREMLKQFKSFSRALDAKPDRIREIDGMGEKSALFFSVMREAMRRYYLERVKKKDVLKSPEDVVNYCRAALESEDYETFHVLFLTARNTVISAENLFRGTTDRTQVHARNILKKALEKNATGLIFVHNHPSGETSPSKEDEILTAELTKAAATMNITVHDHVIVGKGGHFSFRTAGMLK